MSELSSVETVASESMVVHAAPVQHGGASVWNSGESGNPGEMIPPLCSTICVVGRKVRN